MLCLIDFSIVMIYFLYCIIFITEETLETNEIQISAQSPTVTMHNSSPSPAITMQSSSLQNTTVPHLNISWDKMPKKFMTALKKNCIPEPSLRRHMIRIVADDILEITSSPDRKFCREVAKSIAATYPDSFMDKVCGQILSNGFESLTSQLINRCENQRRNSCKKYKNYQEKDIESPDVVDSPIPPKKRITDSYGCVSWNPEFPVEESKESLLKKKI